MILLLMLLFTVLSLSNGYCQNDCNGHGTCGPNDKCTCFKNRNGDLAWIGNDCGLRTCPLGQAWVGYVLKANDLHPPMECSNKGLCDRQTGICQCFTNYEGIACERTICVNDCSSHGVCYTQKQLAAEAGHTYTTPWDANRHVGCVCDLGYRGPDCSMIECPSGPDVMKGPGNESGRECSGRGVCNFTNGMCSCYLGYYGLSCQYQTANI